jgi:hypothetical protein
MLFANHSIVSLRIFCNILNANKISIIIPAKL